MNPLTSANDLVSSSGRYFLTWFVFVVVPAAFSISLATMVILDGSLMVILISAVLFGSITVLWFVSGLRLCGRLNRWVWFDQITGDFQIGRKGQQMPFVVAGVPRLKFMGSLAVVHLKSLAGAEVIFLPTFEFYCNLKNDRYPVLRSLHS